MASLKKLMQEQKTLVVISSDFCHYGSRFEYNPQFKGKTAQETVDQLNMAAVDAIKQFPQAFKENLEETENTICGRHSIFTGLQLFDKYEAELVSYTNSGDLKDRYDSSVSYCGIVGK